MNVDMKLLIFNLQILGQNLYTVVSKVKQQKQI